MKHVWRFSLLALALTQMQWHARDALSQRLQHRQPFPFTSAGPNQAATGIERYGSHDAAISLLLDNNYYN